MVKYLDDDDDAFDANGVCRDGRGVRVSTMIMDSRRFAQLTDDDVRDHQPHFGRPSDAVLDARKQARDAYVRRTCEAWRTAGRVQSKQDADPSEPDPNAANAAERELETWQGRDPAELARDVERRRRAVHAEFCNTLSNAWRGGR
jgi:hypothetical protein